MALPLDREIGRVRQLFDAEHLTLVIDAVIAGNAPARVWVDDLPVPRTALVWDGAHCVYLAGPADRPEDWRELFEREVVSNRPGFLKLYVTDDSADSVFAGYPLRRRERVLYQGNGVTAPDLVRSPRIPAGFRISAIDKHVDELRELTHFADVVAEIASCWNSVEDFRRQGFGFVAHDAEKIVCWCTAECVSETRCGIGIETVEAFQGQGFATLTAAAFVEHCVGRKLTPYWDAWTDNLPSVAVAGKVGLHRVETYSIFVCDFS
ncbi:GNAT family N-acetyltransferase [Actinopolymorpha pittospori]|uniref:GNAT superfamily N-acetyltransferase n=1 Tax=Actinopolymorpha pittospori TaxID=648752 RepID=A0A927RAG9_9ACTN|nr:GNAT family N-acetyltransferase [Actinopolymorpha pittospori]MBE1605025.1 GNAT superfamily N-acetyltransferase [Actinopolymorpha pittospori]